MEPVAASEDIPILFYIGQHETRRGLPVSDSLVQEAQRYGVSVICPRSFVPAHSWTAAV